VRQLVQRGNGPLLEQWPTVDEPPPVPAPAVADVIACGAIWFAVLAGKPLIDLLRLDQPLWIGQWSDVSDGPDTPAACLDLLAPGAITRALRTTDASPAEAALCEHLILADIDEPALRALVTDVLRTRQASPH
jgi:hypothetical protein